MRTKICRAKADAFNSYDGSSYLYLSIRLHFTRWHKALAAAFVAVSVALAWYALVMTDTPDTTPTVTIWRPGHGK